MTYILVDKDDIIRNMIEWEGLDYNPAPYSIRPWKDGCEVGRYYTSLLVADVEVAGVTVRVDVPRL